MKSNVWLILFFLGCTSPEPEPEPSPDPNADSDGDGLSDGEEAALGTDPNRSDTDQDGYADGDEIREGTDPLDADSKIYAGGWPYNPNKEALGEVSWDSVPAQGVQVPNFIGVDAHGDAVQLYDFAGLGVPIVLDFGTKFCQPCKDIAAFLSTGDMSPLIWNDEGDYYPWWKAEYEDLYRQVQAGELIWITVLFSLDDPGPTQEDCESWDASYPNAYIPVLADSTNQFSQWMEIGSYPAISILNDDMTLEVYQPSGPFSALQWLFRSE